MIPFFRDIGWVLPPLYQLENVYFIVIYSTQERLGSLVVFATDQSAVSIAVTGAGSTVAAGLEEFFQSKLNKFRV